jgi:hypothetical protein
MSDYTKAKPSELPDGVLVLEPRSMYDAALVGYTDQPKDHWTRDGGVTVAVYSEAKCVKALMADGMSEEDALEWFSYNTSGAWVGEGTPMFVR